MYTTDLTLRHRHHACSTGAPSAAHHRAKAAVAAAHAQLDSALPHEPVGEGGADTSAILLPIDYLDELLLHDLRLPLLGSFRRNLLVGDLS